MDNVQLYIKAIKDLTKQITLIEDNLQNFTVDNNELDNYHSLPLVKVNSVIEYDETDNTFFKSLSTIVGVELMSCSNHMLNSDGNLYSYS